MSTIVKDPVKAEKDAKEILATIGGIRNTLTGWVRGKSDEEKYRDAAGLYMGAAVAYINRGMNKEAGKAYKEAAAIYRDNLDEGRDAADAMREAFKVFRKEDPVAAIECMQVTIDVYTGTGQFRRAATEMEKAAEVLEVEMGDRKKAMEFYNKAAQWYENDGAKALANKLYLKEADLAALEGDYYRAMTNFEKVADSSLENHLMKYSVKDYWLKAGLCILATKDLVAAHRNLDTYKQKDPSFAGQRECQLLTDLIEAVEAGNQEVFTDKLYAYDQMSRLDKWKTEILVRIKNQIEEADNEFS